VSSFDFNMADVIALQVGGVVHRVTGATIVDAASGAETAPLEPGRCVLATVSSYGQPADRMLVPLSQVQAFILKPA
jgi:hypothetical protein